jgi:predicted dehydrogenase
MVAAAPDTFLGAGLQTCRQVIDKGLIGEPTAATAFMAVPGHERWHPNPGFFYKEGGGPLLDMGPYYLTALVTLLGSVKSVNGLAKATHSQRTITSQPLCGQKIEVEVNTHLSASLLFESGVIATIIMSFDVHKHNLPKLEIYGTRGALSLPDPNTFEGPVRVYHPEQADLGWQDVPLCNPYSGFHRGIGAADLATALRSGRQHRATGEQAAHVLDAMLAVEESASSGSTIELQTSIHRPEPLPLGLSLGELD